MRPPPLFLSVIISAIALGVSVASYACTPPKEGATPDKGTQLEVVSINAAACVLENPMAPPEQLVTMCGIPSVASIAKILLAHRAGMRKELAARAVP